MSITPKFSSIFTYGRLFIRGFASWRGILGSDWSHYALDRHTLSCAKRNKL